MESKLSFENKAKISDVKIMIGYLFILYFVWSIKELWLRQYIYSFDETTSAFLEALVKSFIWIVPAWLYSVIVRFSVPDGRFPRTWLQLPRR